MSQLTSLSYETMLRASGVDRVVASPFCATEDVTTLFKSVPLPLKLSLDGASRNAA